MTCRCFTNFTYLILVVYTEGYYKKTIQVEMGSLDGVSARARRRR